MGLMFGLCDTEVIVSMGRRQVKGYAEQDAFTRWKHVLCYTQRVGVSASIKRGARRRERREAKQRLRGDGAV